MSEKDQDVVEGQVVVYSPTLDDARVAEVVRHFALFEQLKTELLDSKRDAVYYNRYGKVVPAGDPGIVSSYICKSGWLKLSVAFGVHFEAVPYADGTWGRREEREDANGSYYLWQYHVKASMPDGRSVPAVGVCTSRDPFFTKGGKKIADEANVMLKAQTVAFNRAIAFLIAGGELSAEEIAGRLSEEPGGDEPMTDGVVMPFGKHEGQLIADIFTKDPNYLAWLASDRFEPRTDNAEEVKGEAIRILEEMGKGMDELLPPSGDEPVPEPIVQADAPWATIPTKMKLNVAGAIMYLSIGQLIEGYEPSADVRDAGALWPQDVQKLNGHIGKRYLGEDPPSIDGEPSSRIRRMTWGSILGLLSELRSRHWLLKELPARADAHIRSENMGGPAMAHLVSGRYAEAHGRPRGWNKWQRAVVHDLTPDEIKDLRDFLGEQENPFLADDKNDLDAALAEMVA